MGAGNERIEWRFHVHGSCARTGAAVSVSIDAATDEEAQARAWDAVPELDVSEIEREPNTLIMSCTAAKIETGDLAMPISELYLGRAWEMARAANPDHWRLLVLSAEYGLCNPRWPARTYDRRLDCERLNELLRDDHHEDAVRLLQAMPGQVYVYGGKLYRRLARVLGLSAGVQVRELVGAGRGCGDHFSALKRAVGGVA